MHIHCNESFACVSDGWIFKNHDARYTIEDHSSNELHVLFNQAHKSGTSRCINSVEEKRNHIALVETQFFSGHQGSVTE